MEIAALVVLIFSIVMIFRVDTKITKEINKGNIGRAKKLFVYYGAYALLFGISSYVLQAMSFFFVILTINLVKWGILLKDKKSM